MTELRRWWRSRPQWLGGRRFKFTPLRPEGLQQHIHWAMNNFAEGRAREEED